MGSADPGRETAASAQPALHLLRWGGPFLGSVSRGAKRPGSSVGEGALVSQTTTSTTSPGRLQVKGYVVEMGQLRPDPAKIKAVEEWPVPATRKQLQRIFPQLHGQLCDRYVAFHGDPRFSASLIPQPGTGGCCPFGPGPVPSSSPSLVGSQSRSGEDGGPEPADCTSSSHTGSRIQGRATGLVVVTGPPSPDGFQKNGPQVHRTLPVAAGHQSQCRLSEASSSSQGSPRVPRLAPETGG
ncbi:uncharacterized protein LOC126387065 isoform X1 [Epinephelus moara]|uniref:uncharacterized protein LOC126387065 isoform X1 n=1 Tax=Epinephelus moara TaxID=300413 RepID=UPI00214DFE87|nr:uncharacterized protein LOC126387065 isoform X1 [Epinephelus moara]XP_049895580.1 uncharacterized protein LOC126387065 isoform X1 [Epinephelus moara]